MPLGTESHFISFFFSRVGNIHYRSILGQAVFEKSNITLLTPFNCHAEPSLIKGPSVIENCFTSTFQYNFVDRYPWSFPFSPTYCFYHCVKPPCPLFLCPLRVCACFSITPWYFQAWYTGSPPQAVFR